MPHEILFSEKQRFTQWWLWLLLIGINGATLWRIIKPLQNGTAPASYTGIILSITISLLVLLLFLLFRLDTEIREDGVYVRFFPLHIKFKCYSWSSISRLYVRKYAPLKEFGGWGVRYGSNGKAYNISGNDGLQIEFTNGKNLLIGTQKPAELSAVLLRNGQFIYSAR
ncbi:hypothetical protein I5907_09045 [Panacibacter sp. DH6]|uniref:Uncharacterized protein n=1 Tax=Panacibacter microcysteis TaxID=2793269 RepID=A0A931GYJ8_9BACT|nr:hypothetical protein [Panacibacter microcysteis]MBG9376377.1 hypothetical protein [Panacibacter microcysteis]